MINSEDDKTRSAKSQIGITQVLQSLQEQSGANEQHKAERHLQSNDQLASTNSALVRLGSGRGRLQSNGCRSTRCAAHRRQPKEETCECRDRNREQQHSAIRSKAY